MVANLSKSITKLMETTNSWGDGEDHMRKPRPHNNDSGSNRRHPNNYGSRQERRKRTRGFGYEATDHTNIVNTSHNIMIIGITAATDPGAADRITFLGCLIYHPWSN
jgi:hypothetical protein